MAFEGFQLVRTRLTIDRVFGLIEAAKMERIEWR
jgi:hypothetical protein